VEGHWTCDSGGVPSWPAVAHHAQTGGIADPTWAQWAMVFLSCLVGTWPRSLPMLRVVPSEGEWLRLFPVRQPDSSSSSTCRPVAWGLPVRLFNKSGDPMVSLVRR
jgi:hypothetical protein